MKYSYIALVKYLYVLLQHACVTVRHNLLPGSSFLVKSSWKHVKCIYNALWYDNHCAVQVKKKNSIWNVMLIAYYCFSKYIKYWNGHFACRTMPKISLGMHTVWVCSRHLYCEVGCSWGMKCLLYLPGCTDWNETSPGDVLPIVFGIIGVQLIVLSVFYLSFSRVPQNCSKPSVKWQQKWKIKAPFMRELKFLTSIFICMWNTEMLSRDDSRGYLSKAYYIENTFCNVQQIFQSFTTLRWMVL